MRNLYIFERNRSEKIEESESNLETESLIGWDETSRRSQGKLVLVPRSLSSLDVFYLVLDELHGYV